MTGERLNIHVVEHGVGSHDFVEPAACEDDVDQLMNKHGKICNCEQQTKVRVGKGKRQGKTSEHKLTSHN